MTKLAITQGQTMIYRAELPTVPGFYWVQLGTHETIINVQSIMGAAHVIELGSNILMAEYHAGNVAEGIEPKYSGPISKPIQHSVVYAVQRVKGNAYCIKQTAPEQWENSPLLTADGMLEEIARIHAENPNSFFSVAIDDEAVSREFERRAYGLGLKPRSMEFIKEKSNVA